MEKRKFTYKDVVDWKVINVNGEELILTVTGKDGKKQSFNRFDGFLSASRAAKSLGGYAVRV